MMQQPPPRSAPRTDTALTRVLRWGFFALFTLTLWQVWGWGYGLSAALLLLATEFPAGPRRAIVPVTGALMVVLELALSVLGLWTSFLRFGFWLGLLILLAHAAYLLLAARRFRWLVGQPSSA